MVLTQLGATNETARHGSRCRMFEMWTSTAGTPTAASASPIDREVWVRAPGLMMMASIPPVPPFPPFPWMASTTSPSSFDWMKVVSIPNLSPHCLTIASRSASVVSP
jgi:hypothetical protein